MRELFLLWMWSAKVLTSRRRSVSRNREPRKRIGLYEEDRSLPWSTTTFELLVLMTQLDYSDLVSVTLHDDNVQEFDTRWEEVLLCQRFQLMMFVKACTKWEYVSLIRIVKKWRQMVKRNLDQKLRLRNFHARRWTTETGAVVKNRRGLSGVETGKGECHQWKKKGPVYEGRSVQFPHESNGLCTKTDTESRHTFWAIHDSRWKHNEKTSVWGGGQTGRVSILPSSASSSWSFTSSSFWMLPEQDHLCSSPNEESGPLAKNAPLTSYEPKFFDNFYCSETTEIFI